MPSLLFKSLLLYVYIDGFFTVPNSRFSSVLCGRSSVSIRVFSRSFNLMENLMFKIFVFAVTDAVAKSGKPYRYQPIQIIQGPVHPDAHDRLFVNDGSEPLEPGQYTADVYVRSTPTGNKPAFTNFVKAN